MARLNPYLTFNGNCREAMTFYKDCFGGKLDIQTVGESPVAGEMPPQMKNSVMHSQLESDKIVIMGSDLVPEKLSQGNTLALMLDCVNEQEIRSLFEKLVVGGKVNQQVQDTFWGALYGELVDKFGVRWMLNFTKNTNN
ncbi:MAG TPA: VOC family protein [Candidatus Kapabacteria bacterium]|nr:VOC family protein [Candidatus Kapabacteria bacterium]